MLQITNPPYSGMIIDDPLHLNTTVSESVPVFDLFESIILQRSSFRDFIAGKKKKKQKKLI